MGTRPFVLLVVLALALPIVLAGTASATASSSPRGPAPPRTVPFLQRILNGPVPVSGIVALGPPPYFGAPALGPRFSGTGVGILAPTVIALLLPIGAQYRVTNNAGAQNEVSIAVNPTDPWNIVASANDYRGGDGWCGVYATRNGGRTWVEHLIPRAGNLTFLEASGDPSVAFDAAGNVYQSCLGFNRSASPGNVIAVTKSADGGFTWGTPVQVVGTTSGVFHDKEYLAVDRSNNVSTRGNLYLTWTRFMAGGECGGSSISPIYFSRSTDGGQTWSPEREITIAGGRCNQGSQPVVGPGGELYVSWMNYNMGPRVIVTKSVDGGLSWGPRVAVVSVTGAGELYGGAPRTPHFPSIAVNPVDAPTGNRVHAVWTDARYGNADILMRTSTDGGATWGAIVRVNDDAGTNAQFFPWVSASETGRVDVAFYDRRDDAGDRLLTDYVASSFDFGTTFAFNLRASAQFDPGNWFIGDYNGIASFGAWAYPAFCDLRNGGNEEVYMAGPPVYWGSSGFPSVHP